MLSTAPTHTHTHTHICIDDAYKHTRILIHTHIYNYSTLIAHVCTHTHAHTPRVAAQRHRTYSSKATSAKQGAIFWPKQKPLHPKQESLPCSNGEASMFSVAGVKRTP